MIDDVIPSEVEEFRGKRQGKLAGSLDYASLCSGMTALKSNKLSNCRKSG
jgi:hypothetical protein